MRFYIHRGTNISHWLSQSQARGQERRERFTQDDVKRLASLPTRDELLGQLAGLMHAPMQGFVGALDGLLYQMVGVLEALREQRATAEPQA